MPELKGLLQTTGQKITRLTAHIQSQIALKMFGTSRIDLVLDVQRRLNISNGLLTLHSLTLHRYQSPCSVDFPLFLLGLFYVYVKPFNITQVVVITLNPRLLFNGELILRSSTLQLKLCFK